MMINDDRCVCCGRYVPEGRMVCPLCEDCPSPGDKETEQMKRESSIKDLVEYLKSDHVGKGSAITGCELSDRFGKDLTTIQRYVRKSRKNGIPICSCNKGYFYAADQDEINNTVAWMNNHVTGLSNSRTNLLYAVITSKAADKKVKKIRIVMEQEEGNDEEFSIYVGR